jgi:ASC-1-like (ASCH) protein
MKKTLSLFIFSGIFLAGCSSDENIPENITPTPQPEVVQETTAPEKNPAQEEKQQKEGFISQEIEEVNLKVSYPKEWGDLLVSKTNPFLYLTFSTKQDKEGGIYHDYTTFKLLVIDLMTIEDWNTGKDSNPFYLGYFSYLESKLKQEKFEECEETLFLGGRCFDPRFLKLGEDKYLSFLQSGGKGAYGSERKYITKKGDKIIILSSEELGIIEYETMNEFLSQISFENTNSDEEIAENIKNFENFKNEEEKRGYADEYKDLDNSIGEAEQVYLNLQKLK